MNVRWFGLCLSLMVAAVSPEAAETLCFRRGGTVLELAADGKSLIEARTGGSPTAFQGDPKTALWRLRFFDEETAALNRHPLRPAKGGLYWQDAWRESNRSECSLDAELTAYRFDPATGAGELRYLHPKAQITLFFTLTENRIELRGEAVNRAEEPLTKFELLDDWRIDYTPNDRFLMPMVGGTAAIEYRRIKHFRQFMNGVAWDGFLIEQPGRNLFSCFLAQPESDGPFMPTETVLRESAPGKNSVLVRSGLICFRRKGETVRTPRYHITSHGSLREFADAYWRANQPGMKKLAEKMPATVAERLAGAVMFPAVGPMRDVADLVGQLPGTVILHTPDYMRPAGEFIAWDSFPNYFPPNPKFGSFEEYRALIGRARAAGHLFMPRNSFFYWVEQTDAARKYGLENLAVVRIDRLPRTAQWAIPGVLVSPSSKQVTAELEENFTNWRDLGSELYFTNVLSAIGPYGNRYDFHPDAPGPDLFYDQIRKMMKRHGDRIALFSEEGGHWQVPMQCGFFLRPFWEKNSLGPSHWNAAGRGDAVRLRLEIGVYLLNEYLLTFPHNAMTTETVKSIRDLGLSLLYHNGLKYGFSAGAPFRDTDWRWMRTLALFGDKVMRRNFGARLLDFQYLAPDRYRANYQGMEIVMNDSDTPMPCRLGADETVIAPGGFAFRSTDGKLSGGWFREYRNHRLREPQLILIDAGTTPARLYAPLADTPFELALDGAMAAIAVSEPKPGREIPSVAAVPAEKAPVFITLHWNRENAPEKLEYLERRELDGLAPVLRVENFTADPVKRNIPVGIGDRETVISVEVPPGQVRETVLPMPDLAACEFRLGSESPLSFAPEQIPALMPRADAETVAPVRFEAELGRTVFNPGNWPIEAAAGAQSTPFGWLVDGTAANVRIGSAETVFRKKILLECVFKFQREPEGITRGECELLYAIRPLRNEGRSLELRYSRHHRALRFLLTTGNETYYDLSAFDTPLEPGRWHHAVAGWDGAEQFLIVNGKRYSRHSPITLKEYEGPWQIGPGLNGWMGKFRIGGE